jgi:hypothetical protein
LVFFIQVNGNKSGFEVVYLESYGGGKKHLESLSRFEFDGDSPGSELKYRLHIGLLDKGDQPQWGDLASLELRIY